ncbi:MAG: hypothetical protein O9262_04230, partial [Cyclobacteriaceae bacterium]|nr:hypothetical protein [Cyclobacteriaceae bacterium]
MGLEKSTKISLLGKLLYMAVILLSITIPLSIKSHNLAIVSFLALAILALVLKGGVKQKWRFHKLDTLILLQFAIVVVGMTYTTNINNGLSDLERAI